MTWMDFWVFWIGGIFFAFMLWCLECVSFWWLMGAGALLFGFDAIIFAIFRKRS